MASLGHIAFGMAAGRAYSPDPAIAKRAMFWFAVVSLWPDADAIGFALGIKYEDPFGHRGATHSILVGLAVGLAAYFFAKKKSLPPARTAIITSIVAVSHGLFDTMTSGGGHGCALLWPFSDHRFWAPEMLRIIPIAPIGLRIISVYGAYVMFVELIIFAPFWIYALAPRKKKQAG